ncbi:MAG: hypothetical protein GX986_01400 [Firmicutes bacterium]|nr:hypothetical protein [Bacillota bacterium]
MQELYILLGGILAWIGLLQLRMLNYSPAVRQPGDRNWRLRRLAGAMASIMGLLLAVYGAW